MPRPINKIDPVRITARAPGATAKPVYSLAVRPKGDATEIDLYGEIGFFGVSAERFKEVLNGISTSEIHLFINSPGGSVFDGIAIYNDLIAHPAKVIVTVRGLAASIASVIAMAGDQLIMGDGSFLMIHNSWTVAVGDTREMGKISRTLAQFDKSIAGIYADKTGIKVAEIAGLMDDETWFDAESAESNGFADSVEAKSTNEKSKVDASAAFDLSIFRNAPVDLLSKPASSSNNQAHTADYSAVLTALDGAILRVKG